MTPRLLINSVCCGVIAVVSGCSSFPLDRLVGEKIEFASADNPAAEMVCLWEHGKGNAPDGKPARGFNGTILFFDRTHSAPLGVRGKVTFYLYDDYGPADSWEEPIAEYSFTAEQWQHFFEVGSLGACYRVFIPYPRQHPYQVNATLWVKYEPVDGQPAFYSQKSTVVLPGKFRDNEQAQIIESRKLRDRSPGKLKEVVAETFAEAAVPKQQRSETLMRWDPGQPTSVMESSHIDLTHYKVTQGAPAGAFAGGSESAPGAGAESWGSTPPALSHTSHSTTGESAAPRKRFKLTAPEE